MNRKRRNNKSGRGYLYGLGVILIAVAALGWWLNQRVQTADITQRVHEAVEGSGLSLEYVEVLGAEVILSGQIVSAGERADALRILEAVPGVEKVTDNRVLQRTRQATLEIRAFGSSVILRGELPDQASVDAVLAAIRKAYGNVTIDNQLRSGDTTIAAPWIGELGVLLKSLAAVEPLHFSIAGHEVSVSGTARGKKIRNALDRHLRRIFGNQFLVVNEVVLPTRIELAELQFRRSHSEITLQGVFPTQQTVDRIVTTVRSKFPGAQIRYDLALNSDASEPGWLDGTLAILEALAVADPASVEVSNGGLELSGQVTSESIKADLENLARYAFSDPLPVTTEIKVVEPTESALLIVRIANGEVVLEGTVPSRRFETEVLASADVTFGPERVTNLIRVDDRVKDPGWLGSALAQLTQLKNKPNALLTASDTGIDFKITPAPAQVASTGPDPVSSKGQVRIVVIEDTVDTPRPAPGPIAVEPAPVSTESPPPEPHDGAPATTPEPAPAPSAAEDARDGGGTTPGIEEVERSSLPVQATRTQTGMPEPRAKQNARADDTARSAPATALQASLSAVDVSAVQFALNSAELTAAAGGVLDKIARILESHEGGIVEIGGHTDSQGSEAYNLALSEKRAASVARYLAERCVAADRLVARGYGERLPIAGNDTADGRRRNRRIELKVLD